ncbi:ABC-type transport auxiliary lipoprotein family protein [Halomonas faecis]|uniref:ABC-type transport auxiliary lipoprotein family protein n=1 Tax=Halomonas faecis TaxID=1562110 RepID=UPI0013D83633|nr:ABC-type transport auxiliary lipoprotein family protein [Halomonas faecis]
MTRLPMPRLAMALSLLMIAGLPAGCSLFPEREPVRLFTLSEPSLSASADATRDLTLRVDTPSAGALLDGPRLLVTPSPGEFQAYAGARWSDDAPSLVRDYLIEAFRLDGRLAAVVDDSSRARSDATLASHLGAFHSRDREGTPEVVARLEVQLLDESSREVLASRRIEAVVASEDESLEAVVAAFGRASDALARELIDWTLAKLVEP